MRSMTGFGRGQANITGAGQVIIEVRSTNHKFLETILHLPEGFLSLEDKMKKFIESSVKRGRITCVVNVPEKISTDVFINEDLLKKYLVCVNKIKNKCSLKGELDINNLINLPGVISLAESSLPINRVWPVIETVLKKAVEELVKMQKKEGLSLWQFMNLRAKEIKMELDEIKEAFRKVIKEKVGNLKNDAEKSSFLKDSDITEEIERLDYHIKHFKAKLNGDGSLGKELDFIAQEMQREANTMGAKSCDVEISRLVVQLKSKIEKIREQVQNIM